MKRKEEKNPGHAHAGDRGGPLDGGFLRHACLLPSIIQRASVGVANERELLALESVISGACNIVLKWIWTIPVVLLIHKVGEIVVCGNNGHKGGLLCQERDGKGS